uniref:Aa_trans domain-containing protein n=1 Tax=Gongylonema pulchrum TaxID=637853 RepID=A0A183E6N8_9BILA
LLQFVELSPASLSKDNLLVSSEDLKATASIEKSEDTKRGIGWFVAALFILADLVGGGVVAMPAAFVQTGLVCGILFMTTICGVFSVTGYLLADTWEIMRDRWPEYRMHCRKPFPEMGLRSMGKKMEIATQLLVFSSLFGSTVVFLLLSSKIFQNFLANFHVNIHFCILLIIVAGSVLPSTFLKSPADYWYVLLQLFGLRGSGGKEQMLYP